MPYSIKQPIQAKFLEQDSDTLATVLLDTIRRSLPAALANLRSELRPDEGRVFLNVDLWLEDPDAWSVV